jgi:murein DD-endopeptidase MepM/ murein hydrolase activator NlpD
LPNVPGGTPRARPLAPARRAEVDDRRFAGKYRPYLAHLALLSLVAIGALAGSRGLSGAASTPGVLLPPNVRYSTQLVLGTTPGLLPGGSEPVGEPQTPEGYAVEATAELVVEQFAFKTHEVAVGDTLTSIGAQYGVDSQYLIWNNPEMGVDPDMLVTGETLVVPGTPGIVYDVKLGDTITDIAATYAIDPAVIVSFAPNDLESADVIVEGSTLVLPGGVPPPPPPPPIVVEEPAPVEAEPPPPEAEPAPLPVIVPSSAPQPAPAPVAAVSAGYIWPVNGPLNSRFGPRWGTFHSGIDIGAGYGTGVSAAASGQVVLASYSGYGYGNYIIVRHGDGSETLYAHLSSIWVSLGQYVGEGEIIGAVGCTGWCTGPHLHFEVRIGGSPVDPLAYLS